MAVHRLTDRWISSCPAPKRGRLDFADAICPGLHVRVSSRGRKSFSVMLRVNRRLQRRTLGCYPRISLSEARSKALEMQRGAAEGVDPREDAARAQPTITYAELVELYKERHLTPNTRSGNNISRSLLQTQLRHLFTRPAAGITKREVVDAIDNIAATAPQGAVNILRRLKMLFNWAVDRDLLPANPCERIRPPAKTVERDRVLADAEIAAVWQASHQLPTPYGEMYRMFMLTGQRRSEVGTMRWSEVEGDVWTIPREKVKKDRPHTVPLTAAAQDVLVSLAQLPRALDDNGFVFTTTGGKSSSSNFAKVKRELDALSGVSGWTIHDIRRTVRSKLAELGVPREVARKVLNHEDGKVDRIYNRHEYLAEKREALEKWESKLMGLTKANVFPSICAS